MQGTINYSDNFIDVIMTKSIIDEIESMKKEEFPPKFTEQKICKFYTFYS